MNRDLVRDVSANMRSAICRFADHAPTGESTTFGGLTAVSSGLPSPMFNRVFVFETPDAETLSTAMAWMAEQAVPYLVTAPDTVRTDLERIAPDVGLTRTPDIHPGMALASLDALTPGEAATDPPTDGTPVTIEHVTDEDGIAAFAQVMAESFELPLEFTRVATPPSMLDDDHLTPLLGRCDGDAVACGLLVRNDDIAGVYSIGVTDANRRRGVGHAMTTAVLEAGRDAGCAVGTLQSSPLGHSLYERMGFETVVDYHQFQPV
ncbi:GNAT family N-acetyltransferase [Natronomonas sp. EA1]|uniref:GNAT family N-acetyltransferase n=1 Tax=Natronomonas sp. EA1 TaxID=3421655 RepID=UPI003EBEBF2F